MSGDLLVQGDDGGAARCAICHDPAVGPCASCHRPVCGDCCTLTEGGVKTWAICTTCERRGGSSLRSPWIGLVGWLAIPVGLLAAIVAALMLLR